jgi:LacI family transcriptional regulator
MTISPGKVTIYEVAQLAGVSIGTVSRAVNGRHGISSKTRSAVLEVVKRTGFVPDGGARRLARGTHQLIGIAPFNENTLRNPYFAYLLDAIQESLYLRGFVARVIDSKNAEAVRLCSGFIVPGIHLDDQQVQALRKRRLPLAVIGRFEGDISWIDLDNRTGMKAAVNHLLRLGHTRIAHLTGSPIGQTAQHRLEAYREALAAQGLSFDSELVLDGGFTEVGAYRAVRNFIKARGRDLPFTAIAASSDEMAMGAIQALTDHDFRVPRDISVTGFDDLPFAKQFTPGLTTVHQPVREVGHQVAELLLEAIEHAPARQIIVPTELIVRASTGPIIG